MRRVLIISPHFPPTNAPDMQRVRMSLPFYRENGWEPVVLAVDSAVVEAPVDPLLAETVPADVPVHRVGAWPVKAARRLGLGNIGYRAWLRIKAEGDRLLAGEKFDLVYFSTTQFVVTALGRRWRRRFGVPFVVDLQDPWQTDYYDRPGAPPPPGGWKYRFARWQAARMEGPAWRDAAGFTAVSADYLTELGGRYPWFAAKPSAVVPFGAPETDFEKARAQPGLLPAFVRIEGKLHLVSVGAAGPIMRRALERLFSGVQAMRAVDPGAAARLRFHFIGTSYAPAKGREPSVRPVAEEFGVGDLVEERPERVGYFTALKTMLAADAVVITGSDDMAYNPSKTAACFLARKPVLALTPPGSALDRMVSALGFAVVAPFPARGGVDPVSQFLQQVLDGKTALPATRAEETFASLHTARARTRQQCALFDQAVEKRR
ncbi:MAG: hypothetical protein JWM88_3302 [Verrucomicrobia bacterium]|nr:hypothetical protein [Verrucomicrobiota bacterium]